MVNARNMDVLRVSEDRAAHGEGPIWDARTQNLHWVDMLAGDLLSLRVSDGFAHRQHVATVLAVLRPRRMGGFVMALERGFAILDDRSATPRYLGDLWTDISVRMNDGGCDPQGRFYAGSMAYDQTPGRGTLYRLELDESVTVVLNDVTISNGLVWSVDAETVYYIDSATQRVDAFDFDAGSGTFSNRRPFVLIDPTDGCPDGMTIDAEGGLWVALWGGGAVRRYTASGKLDEVVRLPVPMVTACTFGGPELDQLFITTSQVGCDASAADTASGALFCARPGIAGAVLPACAASTAMGSPYQDSTRSAFYPRTGKEA